MNSAFSEPRPEKDNDDIRGKRAAGYVRVSTKEQEKQETSKIQLERITEEVRRKGCPLVETYIDEGYSGELMERPDLDRLLTEIEEKNIEVVLITDPDRLARDYILGEILRKEIQKRGATVFFLSLPPAKSPEQEFSHRVVAAAADLDRKKIKLRTRLGKLLKARRGFVVGGKPPYGYGYLPRTRQRPGYYRIVEEEATWLREIFRWFVFEGWSPEKIARRLTELGVPTQSGNSVWKRSTVHRILHNETYAGLAHYNKLRAVQPKHPQKVRRYRRFKNTSRETRPKKEWIPIKVPRIIDEETWERVQTRFEENARLSSRNTRHPYLLRGKVFCGLCGLPYYGGICRSCLFYQCSNRHHLSPLPKTCSAKSVKGPLLDSLVWETISRALSHPDIIISELRKVAEDQEDTFDWKRKQLETVKGRLEQLESAQSKLTHLYLFHKEAMSEKKYLHEVAEIRARKQSLEEEQKHLESDLGKSVDLEALRENINYIYYEVLAKMDVLDFEKKRRLVELLVDKVIITGNKLRIEGIIPPSDTLPSDQSNTVAIAPTSSPC